MPRLLASVSALLAASDAYMLSQGAASHLTQQQQQQQQLSVSMVATASRRTAGLREQVEEREYQPGEAVALMKKLATAKFDETAELHGNLNLDPKYNDQQIRTTVSLPHGTGNDVRVAVLAEGAAADAAKAAGADLVGFDDLIEDISGGKTDFDVLLATPPAMPKLAKLGKVLGPKGLMPSPKAGTVSADPGSAVGEFKAGKIEFRTDKQGIVHVPFGAPPVHARDIVFFWWGRRVGTTRGACRARVRVPCAPASLVPLLTTDSLSLASCTPACALSATSMRTSWRRT
jgi:large subunit ribosomal protein L1